MPELYPYQRVGAAHLAERTHAALFDEPGLGKTAQAVTAAVEVNPSSVLVVCPASLRETWLREFRMWGGGHLDVTVISYPTLVNKGTRRIPSLLIVDESHYIKSPRAKRTKIVLALADIADRVWFLTGTPMPNNPSELYTTFVALAPDRIPHPKAGKRTVMDHWRFTHQYCVVRNNGFGDQIVKGRNLGSLRGLMKGWALWRRKEHVLEELPEIRYTDLPIQPKIFPHDTEIDPDIHRIFRKEGLEGLRKKVGSFAEYRRLVGLSKVSPISTWLQEFLFSTEEKIVVFAHHRDVLAGLRSRLGADSCLIEGSTPAAQRQGQVDLFQTSPHHRVFFGQMQAAGTGITLTAASNLLFVESSWVPAENHQAAMRIHRIGQKDGCLVRFAHIPGTIDEDIQRAVRRKTADIEAVMA